MAFLEKGLNYQGLTINSGKCAILGNPPMHTKTNQVGWKNRPQSWTKMFKLVAYESTKTPLRTGRAMKQCHKSKGLAFTIGLSSLMRRIATAPQQLQLVKTSTAKTF